MRARFWFCSAAALLACACHNQEVRPDQTAESDRAVAMVEAANRTPPPVRGITPQPIAARERATWRLHGPGCEFVRDGSGMAADAIAFADRAVMMIDGNAATFAADPGAATLPLGARSHYVGKGLSLSLTRLESEPRAPAGDRFAARLVVSDPQGRSVFEAEGDARCAKL